MDFVAPTFQNPDILRAAALGQQMGQQAVMFPYQVQQAQQQTQQGALTLQQLQMALQFQGMKNQAIGGALGEMSGTQSGAQSTQTGQTPGGPTGGIQNGPQGSVSASTDAGNYGFSPSPLSQQSRRIIGALAPEMLKGMDEGDNSALKTAQVRSQMPGSPLVTLEAFANNPNADLALTHPGNSSLLAQWPALAMRNGVDPRQINSFNVRTVATMEANKQRAALSLPPLPMPQGFQTVQQGNGQSYQVALGGDDPGKISSGASAVQTDKYIVNGKVVELPKAQGVAQGLTPYDGPLFAADILKNDASVQSSPALEQAYQQFKATGTMPPIAGRDAIAIANESKYIAQRSQQEGLTGATAAAQQQTYAAQGKVLNDYTDPSGKAGGKLQNINTVTEHAQALYPLIDAMKNGPSPALNAARVAYERQTGQPAPTSYQAMANIFTGELNTAINQGDSGDKEGRERILAPFANVNGPDVLKDAIRVSATAMAGKTHGLEQGWNAAGMQETHGPFSQFLSPATKQFLGGGVKVPDVGTVSRGYRFLGGDPSKATSWVKAGG